MKTKLNRRHLWFKNRIKAAVQAYRLGANGITRGWYQAHQRRMQQIRVYFDAGNWDDDKSQVCQYYYDMQRESGRLRPLKIGKRSLPAGMYGNWEYCTRTARLTAIAGSYKRLNSYSLDNYSNWKIHVTRSRVIPCRMLVLLLSGSQILF